MRTAVVVPLAPLPFFSPLTATTWGTTCGPLPRSPSPSPRDCENHDWREARFGLLLFSYAVFIGLQKFLPPFSFAFLQKEERIWFPFESCVSSPLLLSLSLSDKIAVCLVSSFPLKAGDTGPATFPVFPPSLQLAARKARIPSPSPPFGYFLREREVMAPPHGPFLPSITMEHFPAGFSFLSRRMLARHIRLRASFFSFSFFPSLLTETRWPGWGATDFILSKEI